MTQPDSSLEYIVHTSTNSYICTSPQLLEMRTDPSQGTSQRGKGGALSPSMDKNILNICKCLASYPVFLFSLSFPGFASNGFCGKPQISLLFFIFSYLYLQTNCVPIYPAAARVANLWKYLNSMYLSLCMLNRAVVTRTGLPPDLQKTMRALVPIRKQLNTTQKYTLGHTKHISKDKTESQ
jgi:hypothetical protein